jgi:protocatechuate 3,4-dioxygenase beta subunit
VLGALAEDERATLIATAAGATAYSFDIRLQGDAQTVFFTTEAFGL